MGAMERRKGRLESIAWNWRSDRMGRRVDRIRRVDRK